MPGNQKKKFCLAPRRFEITAKHLRIGSCISSLFAFILLGPSESLPARLRPFAVDCQQIIIRNVNLNHPLLVGRHPVVLAAWALMGFVCITKLEPVVEFLTSPNLLDRVKMHLIDLAAAVVPSVRVYIDKKVTDAVCDMRKSLKKPVDEVFTEIPETGMSESAIESVILRRTAGESSKYSSGKISGTVYFSDEKRLKFLSKVMGDFCLSNLLHPEVFPGVVQMEAEIIRMVSGMFSGDENVAGCVTSGGTESLLMAVKTYRDWAKETRGVLYPEVILSVSAHAAFDKAEDYFGVKLIHIPVDPKTGEVNLRKVRRAINKNTIMLVGSAPSYPHGVIDNIPALGQLAYKYNIGLHVDCCLGSFVVPHQKLAGFAAPYNFDFSVRGVTSISCDTHKFGCAPKGTSVILYKDAELRGYQFFTCPEWTGGIYASPSIAGSRAGSSIAAAWAAVLSMGKKNYVECAKSCVSCAHLIAEGVRKNFDAATEIELAGRPDSMVVAFRSKKLPVYAISEAMAEIGGWHLNNLQNPASVHLCVTLPVAGSNPAERAAVFLNDLRKAVDLVKKDDNGVYSKKGGAAMYGMAATVPQELVGRLTKSYFDVMLELAPLKKTEGTQAAVVKKSG